MSLLASFLVHTLLAFVTIFFTLGTLYILEDIHGRYMVESLGLVAWLFSPLLSPLVLL